VIGPPRDAPDVATVARTFDKAEIDPVAFNLLEHVLGVEPR